MKTLRLLFMALTAIMLSASFAACSGDDEEGKSDGNASGLITDEDGNEVRVTCFDGYKFSYNSKGQLIEYKIEYNGGGPDLEVSQSPFTLTYTWYSSISTTYNISQNNKGYITKVTGKSIDDGEEYGFTYTFSYDDSGHLTKYTGNIGHNGEEYTVKKSVSLTMRWSKNVLTSMTRKAVYMEDGKETENVTEYITFDYGDNEYPNPSHQLAKSYSIYDYLPFGIDGFSFIGMFGKGGDYLPTTVTEEYDGGGDSYSYSYGYNDDGTLNYVREDGLSRQYYSYGSIDNDNDDDAKAMKKAPVLKQKKSLRLGFLGHHTKK